MAKNGRPSIYSEELVSEICRLIAHGTSLVKICKMEGMPDYSTVMDWLDPKHQGFKPGFPEKYARAKSDQADFLAEEILDIADNSSGDRTEDGIDYENINRSRLRVDSRKWIASKLKPKKYGEKLELAGDPNAPIKTEHKVKFENMSVEELQRFLAAGVGPASADQG